jgi:hypothetical protein
VAAVTAPTDLLGTWILTRRIVDRRTASGRPAFGRVTGTLTLAASSDGEVAWCERGTLSWAGQQLPVFRNLRIVHGGAGWTVCFEDGHEFHPWQPGAPLVHPCRADTYRGVVDVDGSRRLLRVLWDVTGPSKDARLFTRCVRNPG